MSLTLDEDSIEPNKIRLEFIEEHKKSLVLKNEEIEYYNSVVEIGFEHYLLGLGWSADSVIVEDWIVCKRIEAEDAANAGKFFTIIMPSFNIDSFPFLI